MTATARERSLDHLDRTRQCIGQGMQPSKPRVFSGGRRPGAGGKRGSRSKAALARLATAAPAVSAGFGPGRCGRQDVVVGATKPARPWGEQADGPKCASCSRRGRLVHRRLRFRRSERRKRQYWTNSAKPSTSRRLVPRCCSRPIASVRSLYVRVCSSPMIRPSRSRSAGLRGANNGSSPRKDH